MAIDTHIAIPNTPLTFNIKKQIFESDQNYIDDQLEKWFNENRKYNKNNVRRTIKYAISYAGVKENDIHSIIGSDIMNRSVSISVLKKLAELFIQNGLVNWNFGYWFDDNIRNINIWNFNSNNLSILCDKKDISIQSIYQNPLFQKGFRLRNLSMNQSIDDINQLNFLFNNTKNPKFILGIGKYDDSRIILDEAYKPKIGRPKKNQSPETKTKATSGGSASALYNKNPDKYMKNPIDPKFFCKLIDSSGWSTINLKDLVSIEDGDINLYNLRSQNVSSINKRCFNNILFYLRTTKDFISGKTKSIDDKKIPTSPINSSNNYWMLRSFGWRSLDEDIISELSKGVQIPIWFFKYAGKSNTIYVSERIKELIVRWIDNNYPKYSQGDLFIYDTKKATTSKTIVPVASEEKKDPIKTFMDKYEEEFGSSEESNDDITIEKETVVEIVKKNELKTEQKDIKAEDSEISLTESKWQKEPNNTVAYRTNLINIEQLDKLNSDDLKTIIEYCNAILSIREAKDTMLKIREKFNK